MNFDLINFENKSIKKNEKKSIKNIDFTSATKFLNTNNKVEANEINGNFPLNNLKKNDAISNENKNNEKKMENFTLNEINEDNFIKNNNRYANNKFSISNNNNNINNNENNNSLQNEISTSGKFGNLDIVKEQNNERGKLNKLN